MCYNICGDLYMSDFTFLTKEQITTGNWVNVYILSDYGSECVFTDFSILLGIGHDGIDHTWERHMYKYRTGYWWTKTSDHDNDAIFIGSNGAVRAGRVDCRIVGARPVVPYSSIKPFSSNMVSDDEIKEIEYGEYPQTIVDKNYSKELERAYNDGNLIITGKKYTTDSNFYDDLEKKFIPRTHTEYEYNGSKYIRFKGDSNCTGEYLSDVRKVRLGGTYWVRVEPIIWLIDEEADLALSKKIIFSGVQFNHSRDYNDDFDSTDIKQFMDNYFSKEIVADRVYSQTLSIEQTQNLEEKEPIRKQKNYGFNFAKVSEEDIIKGAIESNIPVFLHGKSSDGKSSRVKQLDPDCEIIYMRNATPDSLNGKSVYDATTGKIIDVPPTWYSKIKEKCETEPDKIHIIFFDELTDALPSIQGMVFNTLLGGEVNGKWKLPPNARIVAAGNDLKDSLATNQMAEPLFNRFAHVYINNTVDSWLKWASTPEEKYERLDYKEEKPEAKIHPIVYAYIAYTAYSNHDVLRTQYTGDKPNADPRKWEMASKVLYKTKQPEMLRALIGEDLTEDFIAFAKQQVISIEDVINHNYSSEDLKMNISQKFATAVGLSSVDDEHFEIARDFMDQLGAEPRAVFESMWAHGDEKSLEKLAEVQATDSFPQGLIKR